tara:strand:+ start:39 stop:236 length:198 start_codon:yes stop_codon:yes gene_type:complete
MTKLQEKQIEREIKHIFESGVNEVRISNMVKVFIENIEPQIEENFYQKGFSEGYKQATDDIFNSI